MKINRILVGLISAVMICQSVFATAPIPDFPTIKQAQKLIAPNKQKFAHGGTLRVRAELNDLLPGDFVTTLVVYGKAGQTGAKLEVIVDSVKQGEIILSPFLSEEGFVINMKNGVDYNSLLLRSIGKTEIQVLTANIGDPESDGQLPPLPPPPDEPPVVQPTLPPQGPANLNEFTANCTTVSRGVKFYDNNEAGAVWYCQNAAHSAFATNAGECEALAFCKNPRMHCSTSSNGEAIVAYSLQNVVRKCQVHPSTNDSECVNFARCEGSNNNGPFPPQPPPPPPHFQCPANAFNPSLPCQTKSNGCKFSSFFLDQVIEQCQVQSPFLTNAEECRTVAVCNGDQGQFPPPPPGGGHVGPLPGGHEECHTSSKGIPFSGPTRDIVIQRCQSHPVTNNTECRINADCGGFHGGHGHGPHGCFAESRGLIFPGPNRAQASADCRAHSQTNNQECNDSVLLNCPF